MRNQNHEHSHLGEHSHEHVHEDGHRHVHAHDGGHDPHAHGDHAHVEHVHSHHDPRSAKSISLERDVLSKNALIAAQNRHWLDARRIFTLNVMSSPGAGKTTLLERTIARLAGERIAVIEGDQETERDADRIRAAGAKAWQINTGTGCHLDAQMVAGTLRHLEPPPSLLMIENVGNLVCPALFDLGERLKVVVLSVTEGDDKPLKYPHMFHAADIVVLNKVDLLPYVSFDVPRFVGFARQINPRARVFQVSATRGDGLDTWCDWIQTGLANR